jgi:hypothetical protein
MPKPVVDSLCTALPAEDDGMSLPTDFVSEYPSERQSDSSCHLDGCCRACYPQYCDLEIAYTACRSFGPIAFLHDIRDLLYTGALFDNIYSYGCTSDRPLRPIQMEDSPGCNH